MINFREFSFNNYRVHLVNTSYSKTINVSFYFGNKSIEWNKFYYLFLCEILLYSNKTYPSLKKIDIKLMDLYSMNLSKGCRRIGNYILTYMGFDILNPKYSCDSLFLDSLSLFFDLLNNPNVVDGCFDDVSFNNVKKTLIASISTVKENKSEYANILSMNTLSKEAPYYEDLDNDINLINSITPSSLYEFYKSFFKNSILDIYVAGCVDETYVDYFKNIDLVTSSDNYNDCRYIDYKDYEYKKYSLDSNVSQNVFNVLIGFKDITDFEYKYVINVFNNIFGGSVDSLLFNSVRGENSLCYYIYSDCKKCDSLIVVKTGITCSSDKVISLVRDCLDKIINGEFSDDFIDNSINSYIKFLDLRGESLSYICYFDINCVVSNSDSISDRIENIKKVTKDDVINFAKKLSICSSFLLGRE